MKEALKLAKKARDKGEVPIGCVVVSDGKIVAKSRNEKQRKNNSLAHAEMIALTRAQKRLKTKYLSSCTLYVTLEPCAMCAGALVNARVNAVVFGAYEPKTGCCGSVLDIARHGFNHKVNVVGGILEEECKKIMQDFFKAKREEK